MNRAQILKHKYEDDLKNLQENCTHPDGDWVPVMRTSGHFSPNKGYVCKHCEKIINWEEPTFPFHITVST